MDRVGWFEEDVIQANPDHAQVQDKPRANAELVEVTPWAGRQEKPLAVFSSDSPYRIPTLVGHGKHRKVDERSSVKELGKLTPYLRKKGCPGSVVW